MNMYFFILFYFILSICIKYVLTQEHAADTKYVVASKPGSSHWGAYLLMHLTRFVMYNCYIAIIDGV